MDANEDESLYAELASLRIKHCRSSAQPFPAPNLNLNLNLHPNPNPNPTQANPTSAHRRTNSSSTHHHYINNHHISAAHRSHAYSNPKSSLTRSGPELLHINLPERKHASRGGAISINGDQDNADFFLHRSNVSANQTNHHHHHHHSNSHHHHHHNHHSNDNSNTSCGGGGGGGGGGLLSSALACLCRPKQPLTLNSSSANSSSIFHQSRQHQQEQYHEQHQQQLLQQHAIQLEALAAIEETRDMWEWQMEQQAALASQENDFLEKRYSCTTNHDTISVHSMHNSTQNSPLLNHNTAASVRGGHGSIGIGAPGTSAPAALINPSHDCTTPRAAAGHSSRPPLQQQQQQQQQQKPAECSEHQQLLSNGFAAPGDQLFGRSSNPMSINACNAEPPPPFNATNNITPAMAISPQPYDCIAGSDTTNGHLPSAYAISNIDVITNASDTHPQMPPSDHRSMDNVSNSSSYFLRSPLDAGNRTPNHHRLLLVPDPDHVVLLFEAALLRCRSEINLFCRVYMQQMVLSGYSLIKTLADMEPGTVFYRKVHTSYALEARICDVMFRCFENDSFDDTGVTQILDREARAAVRLQEYVSMKALDPEDALAMHSATYDAGFHRYCVNKSEEVAGMCRRWRMSYRKAGERDRFMEAFLRAAKSVWMLHRLANAANPSIQIIRVARGMDAHPLYVEPVIPSFFSSSTSTPVSACPHCPPHSPPKVQFMVMPGFISPKLVFKAKVYQHYMCAECTASLVDHNNNISRSSGASSSSSTLASSN